jgi:glycosyltransferase involved in cell wall biosynthesis
MPRLRPDLVLVQSEATRASLAPFGCRMAELTPGIDLDRFRPMSVAQRIALRRAYAVPEDAYVVLHVGHLNRERNVQSLGALRQMEGAQVVVVASSSTPHDAALSAELRAAGVRVIAKHVREIAELYQLADCYVFPVEARMSAIDLPLSVLEAMACDLPVVTTPFGGLVSRFAEGPGFHYAQNTRQMLEAVRACRAAGGAGTRALVSNLSWERVAEGLMATLTRSIDSHKADTA